MRGRVSTLERLVKKSVLEQFKNFDPYLVASFYESTNSDYVAVNAIKHVLANPPEKDDKWAYNLWGVILMKHKFYDIAVNKFNKALLLDNTFFLPYFNLGQIAILDSNYSYAIENFNKALKSNKTFERAYIGIASTYKKRKKLDSALFYIDKSLELNDKFIQGHYEKGEIYFIMGDTIAALESLDKVLELDNTHVGSYYILATIKLFQKKMSSARQLIARAYQLDKTNIQVAKFYQHCLKADGDTTSALKVQKELDLLPISKSIDLYTSQILEERLIH